MTKPRTRLDLETFETELGTMSTQTMALARGQNILTVDKNTPYNVLNIDGRTLVNLLGRDGNCEDASKWQDYQTSHALDSSNKTLGSNGFKVTLATGYTSGAANYPILNGLKAGKYYVLFADSKNGNATNVKVQWGGTDGNSVNGVAATPYVGTTSFQTTYTKANPSVDAVNISALLTVSGTAGQYGYFDAVRLYEITQAEYNALGTTLTDINAITAKYPYIDDVKHVQNPYLIKYGQNLLPPFQDWGLATSATITSSYNVSMTVSAFTIYAYNLPVVAGQQYTGSSIVGGYVSSSQTPYITIQFVDSNGNSLGYNDATTTANGLVTKTVTAPTNAVSANFILACNTAVSSTFTFSNPMLNVGSTALLFVPQNNDYLFLNATLASSVDGSVKDYVYCKDGLYYKSKRFIADLVLDGSLPWNYDQPRSGYKAVYTSMSGQIMTSDVTIKYDGKILKHSTNGAVDYFVGSDIALLNNSINITVANTDSGWGETSSSNTFSGTGSQTAFTLTPPANTSVMASSVTATVGGTSTTAFTVSGNTVTFTTAPVTGTNNVVINYTAIYVPTVGEIQAYFWGYKMTVSGSQISTAYSGTGTKAWCEIYNSVTNPTNTSLTTTALPTSAAPVRAGFTSYKLTYQLTQEQEELVQFEGDLNLYNGGNQIEYGEGVIIREKATSYYYSGNGGRYFNDTTDTTTLFKYKAGNVFALYKNGQKETKAQILTGTTGNGTRVKLNGTDYDPTAEYTVSYIVLKDGAVTSNVYSGAATYNTNLRNVVNQLSQELTDVTTYASATALRFQNYGIKGLGERVEYGSGNLVVTTAGTAVTAIINFSRSFSKPPLILASLVGTSAGNGLTVYNTILPYNPSTTSFTMYASSGVAQTMFYAWIAIGT